MMNNRYFESNKYNQRLKKAVKEVKEKMNELNENWEEISEGVWKHKELEVIMHLSIIPRDKKEPIWLLKTKKKIYKEPCFT